jgi:hypothetical protein
MWSLSSIVRGVVAWGVLCVALPASALEFSADQITKINGHSQKANLYYRDEMWRLEHQTMGPVNVTIVRQDKQLMWLLLSRLKHFKTVSYDPAQRPKIAERLDGEVKREEIGTETLEGHPTTLYEVTTTESGREVVYYQWLATDLRFPLRLARKDGSWTVEYRNVKVRALSDFLFQLPVNFLPLEDMDDGKKRGSDSKGADERPLEKM